MAEPPPPAPDGRSPKRRLSAGDLAKFAGALLASVGLGSLVNRLRKRSDMSDMDQKPKRRVVSGPRKVAADATPRPADDVASSDVAKEKRAKADEDAAIEIKRQIGHEPSDIRLRGLVWTGVATIVIAVLTSVALFGLLQLFQSQPPAAQPPSALRGQPSPPPAPRLQTDPVADWQALQATEQATLNSYGWADRGAGKARIPIDKAIELLVQRGLPVAPGSTRQFNDRTPDLDSSGGREPGPTSVGAPQNTGQTQPEPAAATPSPSH